MKRKILSMIPYVIVMALAYYLLPLLVMDTGSGMFILLFAIPMITFVCGAIYGLLRGLNLLLPIASAVMFLPAVFIFFNESALVYSAIYAGVILVGNLIGYVLWRISKKHRSNN